MRYSWGIHHIRQRRHVVKISLILSGLIILLILLLGFTTLDAAKFFGGFGLSLVRVVIAYFIALAIAIFTALTVTSSKVLESAFIPILDALQSFPAFALFPLLIVWFGRTAPVIIIILVIEMVWPILFTVLTAKKQIREDLIEAAHAFDVRGYNFLKWVLFPLILPGIVTGSIVAWGEAWETIIAAEIIVSISGVGTYLSTVASTNPKQMVIGIGLLLLLLFLLNKYIWLPLLNRSTKYQQE